MARLVQVTEINASPEAVRELFTEPVELVPLVPTLQQVERVSDTVLACRHLVAGMPIRYRVEVIDNGAEGLSWATTSGMLTHQGTIAIEPLGPEATRLTVVLEYETPVPELTTRIANWAGIISASLGVALGNIRRRAEAAGELVARSA
jgi:carbon monoxide dehydrogenase subunit G